MEIALASLLLLLYQNEFKDFREHWEAGFVNDPDVIHPEDENY